MLELVTVAFLLSVDNVRLACSFGLLGSAVGQWWRLAVLMAVVEAAFPLVGAAVAPVLLARVASFEVLGPVLLVVAAALSFVGVVSEQPVPIGRLLYVLPVVFGLDNLIAGAAFGVADRGGDSGRLVRRCRQRRCIVGHDGRRRSL